MDGAAVAAGSVGRDASPADLMRAHPAFHAVVGRAADYLASSYDGNRLLNRVLNDRGRVVFCFLILYLDALSEAEGGGLTVGRMVALCQETGVCSRGRARAMMALMRWGGYLEPVSGEGDRRVKPLAPTAHMRAVFRDRWIAHYRLIETLDPVGGEVLARFGDPVFVNRVARLIGAEFRAGYRLLDGVPDLAAAADRDGGVLVLVALFVAVRQGSDPPTLAELARRFHISRAQVLQIVKEGEGLGLVVRSGESSAGRLTPRGEAALTDFFANILGFFHVVGRRALGEA